jgi:hypothetical protein
LKDKFITLLLLIFLSHIGAGSSSKCGICDTKLEDGITVEVHNRTRTHINHLLQNGVQIDVDDDNPVICDSEGIGQGQDSGDIVTFIWWHLPTVGNCESLHVFLVSSKIENLRL